MSNKELSGMETKIIVCAGLINSNGVKYPAKCFFFLERKEIEHYYKKRGNKIYLGYPVEMYDGKDKLYSEPGSWYVKTQAFETVTASGKIDLWYDNERNMIIKVSQYGKRQLSI